jgi:hypothetical protein
MLLVDKDGKRGGGRRKGDGGKGMQRLKQL